MILNYAGIAVFAASGAVVGVRKGFDLIGIAMLGVLTGAVGSTLATLLRLAALAFHWRLPTGPGS
jgi:uncharacterized membrane protein YeiH